MNRANAQALTAMVLALAVAACAALPDLQFSECGNGVLEPEAGETCDSRIDPDLGVGLVCGRPDTMGACQYLCRDAMECPLGWRCGEDSVCRQPSADFRLGPAGIIDLAASRLSLADLDGDGTLDVVVPGTESVSILFSDGRGGLEATETVTTRTAGRIAFSDTDGDGLQDLAVPTGAGLQVFGGNPSRRLSPLAGSPVPALPTNKLIAYGQGPLLSSGFLAIEASADSWLLDAQAGELSLAVTGEAQAYVLPLGGTVDSLIVADSQQLAIVSLIGDAPVLQQILQYPLGITSTPRHIEAADLDGDADTDLWIDAGGTLFLAYKGPLEFEDISPESRFGTGELLVSGDLNADGVADAVRSDGVWLSETSSSGPPNYVLALRPAASAWSQAAVGHFDDDNSFDLVVVARGEARLEYRLQRSPLVFSAFGVETPGEPSSLVPGDYDGDGIDDIAFASVRFDSTRLSVLFGSDFALVPLHTEAGAFEVQALTAPVAPTHFDSWRDLLVSGGDGVFAFLGTPSRVMQAPFIFGRPRGANIINAVGGDQLTVQTKDPSVWELSSTETESRVWPSCLGPLGPECVLTARQGDVTLYVGPTPGCLGDSVVVSTSGSSCDAMPLAPGTQFNDLSYDADRMQFLIGASLGSKGFVYVQRVGQPLDSLLEIEFAAPVLSAAAADLDSDGISEVLALTPDGVEPRFGADLFTSQDKLELPGLQVGDVGRLRIFDSDGDRLDDLVVGSESRLILFRGQVLRATEAAQ